MGVGRLNTPPPSTSPRTVPSGPTVGVGTNTNLAPSNVTVGVGGTLTMRQQAPRRPTPSGQGYLGDRPTVAYKTPVRPTTRGRQPRRVPRQNTPSSPSDPRSRRESSASGSGRSRRGSGKSRRGKRWRRQWKWR